MKYIFDENIAPQVAKGLKAFGKDVSHITDHLPRGSKDVDVLKYVGERGYTLITRDRKIYKNPAEKNAIYKFCVGVFELIGKDMSLWARVKQVVRGWEQIDKIANSTEPPFVYKVYRAGGKLKRLF